MNFPLLVAKVALRFLPSAFRAAGCEASFRSRASATTSSKGDQVLKFDARCVLQRMMLLIMLCLGNSAQTPLPRGYTIPLVDFANETQRAIVIRFAAEKFDQAVRAASVRWRDFSGGSVAN